MGHRTLRIQDLGKIAATFTDLENGTSLRLSPKPDVRTRAPAYAPDEIRRYFAQLKGYQVMPDEELFNFQWGDLQTPPAQIINHPNARVHCSNCGEEGFTGREVVREGRRLCHASARGG